MKRVVVLFVVSLLLFSLVSLTSAKIGITSRATEDNPDSIEEVGNSNDGNSGNGNEDDAFCGTATLGRCESNNDCVRAGCSSSVCKNTSEESSVTTCEYKNCYNAETYDAKCDCVHNQCLWNLTVVTENAGDEEEKERLKEEIETEVENEECDEWACSKWSNCLNGIKTRNCVKISNTCTGEQETPRMTKTCEEKERIKVRQRETECPEKCECSGSTTKCKLNNGTREITITAGKSGNVIIQTFWANASTKVILYKSDDGKLYGVFRNNETKRIKALPDSVKWKVEERLEKKLKEEKIELNEDGYKFEAKEKAKLFAFIPVKVRVMAEVNPETGEIIRLRKAWWAVFTKKDYSDSMIGGCDAGISPSGKTPDDCCKEEGFDVLDKETGRCEFNED